MSTLPEPFPLAERIANALRDVAPSLEQGVPCELLDQVTPVTARLLRYWFQLDHQENRRPNFHVGQRDAILAIVYAHEVLGTTSLLHLYEILAKDVMLRDGLLGELTEERNQHPKYAAKMATGTGKTWVLNALLVWQYLNAVADPTDPRFSKNFLVVAPGLIVYDRLLDSFLGRLAAPDPVEGDGARDFSTSDLAAQQELFIPDDDRVSVLGWVQSAVITKRDIGRRTIGNGVIALTNWHLLAGKEDDGFADDDDLLDPGIEVDGGRAAASFVPLTPGTSAGNSLDRLDRAAQRGIPLQWLRDLDSLVVFNDEAHHVHSLSQGAENEEVLWQQRLNEIAEGKGRRFMQVDFSATPYNERRKQKLWFRHIVVDFDLNAAMGAGLVKSLVLDKRKEIAALQNRDLDFNAERDERGKVAALSEGQRIMLRAGLTKLRILEESLAEQDPTKHPKLLVMVEETEVSPLVEDFLRSEGYADDDMLRVDSKKKETLPEREWEVVRERLFGIDSLEQPKIIISVLMLREGFDVNNICVIVPLRSTQSGILLEQTVGRGLRLMWRGDATVDEMKRENRVRIRDRQEPENHFDVLFVVEHPRFSQFYEDQFGEGQFVESDSDTTPALGDSRVIALREGWERYDIRVPFILRDADEELSAPRIDVSTLRISKYPLADLERYIGRGDTFASHDHLSKTQYGDYRVHGGMLTARGYNDFLGRIATRISTSVSRTITRSAQQRREALDFPVLQVHRAVLVRWIDQYICTRLFGEAFDPLDGERWRVLMLEDVAQEIAATFATALIEALEVETTGEPEVLLRSVAEVDAITVRDSASIAVDKSIFAALPVPRHGGGLERRFIGWADEDSAIEAFVKIHEYKHDWLRLPYLKADGMPALYSPDFLVRTAERIYVVETKAQSSLSDLNVHRKQRAALSWCERVNALPTEHREGRSWHYVLLGERNVAEWHGKHASASELLAYARITAQTRVQETLFD